MAAKHASASETRPTPANALADRPAAEHDLASAALLAAACGVADAVGFVHTGVFAANMTGNTVLAGLSVANQDWGIALDRIVTLATFFGGSMLGRVLQRVWQHQPALPLFVAASLIAVAAFIEPGQTMFIWLLATAMGIQATAITKVHGMAVSTVVVTSTMARLAESTVDALAGERRPRNRGNGTSAGLASTWLSYAGGAVAGVLLVKAMPFPLLVPAAIVLAVSVMWKARK